MNEIATTQRDITIGLQTARQALEKAETVDEIKKLQVEAEAVRALAVKIGLAMDQINQIAMHKLRCERKAGSILANDPRVRRGGSKFRHETLKEEYGLNKTRSHRWQIEASVDETEFNEWGQELTEKRKMVTSKGLLSLAGQIETRRFRSVPTDVCFASDSIDLVHGDFRERMEEDVEDDSVDMIWTDPPYDQKSIPIYGDLAALAAKKLKPGGSLFCYAGNYAIFEIGDLMRKHLKFWWPIALLGKGGNARLQGKGVYVTWKPIYWWVKGTRNPEIKPFVQDSIATPKPSKLHHDWEQSPDEAAYYIGHLTRTGDLIVDPFVGSGSTAIAASRLNRRFWGSEIDPDVLNVAKRRVKDALTTEKTA